MASAPIAPRLQLDEPTRLSVRIEPALHAVALVSVLAGAAIFIDNERFGPGEAFVATAGVLLSPWLVASAFESLRRPMSPAS